MAVTMLKMKTSVKLLTPVSKPPSETSLGADAHTTRGPRGQVARAAHATAEDAHVPLHE